MLPLQCRQGRGASSMVVVRGGASGGGAQRCERNGGGAQRCELHGGGAQRERDLGALWELFAVLGGDGIPWTRARWALLARLVPSCKSLGLPSDINHGTHVQPLLA